MHERLQKYLARAGIASRRQAERLISEGRVAINNQISQEMGTKVEPGRDLVTIDGKLVEPPTEPSYFLLYKPAGVITSLKDPQGRRNIGDFTRHLRLRVFPIGRLDFDTEGALLLTDDGELAHRLLHPRFQVARTYLAKVKGKPNGSALQKLKEGVRLDDGVARATHATVFQATERNTWIRLVITEGRTHVVKRMCAAIGHPVARLFRPVHAGISAKGLRPGEVRALGGDEIKYLRELAGGKTPREKEELWLPPRRHGRSPVLAKPDAGPRQKPQR